MANWEIRDTATGTLLAETNGSKLDAVAIRQELQGDYPDAWVFEGEF